jgi:hypothetical protein
MISACEPKFYCKRFNRFMREQVIIDQTNSENVGFEKNNYIASFDE